MSRLEPERGQTGSVRRAAQAAFVAPPAATHEQVKNDSSPLISEYAKLMEGAAQPTDAKVSIFLGVIIQFGGGMMRAKTTHQRFWARAGSRP